MYQDLRTYLKLLDEKGVLLRVTQPVMPELEAPILARLAGCRLGRAVLFEKVEGYELSACSSLFTSEESIKMALNLDSLEELESRAAVLVEAGASIARFEKVALLARFSEVVSYAPKVVERGAPVMEVVLSEYDASFNLIPAFRFWPGETGRSITNAIVVARDEETNEYLLSVNRMQVYDEKTASIHLAQLSPLANLMDKARIRGEEIPLAVIISAPPSIYLAARLPPLKGIDPYVLAGSLAGRGMLLTRDEELGLYVPADSEIVLKGYVDPRESRPEGPLGWGTGFYSPPEPQPIFHLTGISMRKDATVYFTVPCREDLDDSWLQRSVDRVLSRLFRALIPGVVRVATLPASFGRILVVAVEKGRPGQARLVTMALAGIMPSPYTKVIVAVDPSVDVRNPADILWAIANNVDSERDIVTVRGVQADELDYATRDPGLATILCIDATKKMRGELGGREPPSELEDLREIEEAITSKFSELLSS